MPERTESLSLLFAGQEIPPGDSRRPLWRIPLLGLRRLLAMVLVIAVSALLVAGLLAPIAGAGSALVDEAHEYIGAGPTEEDLAFPRFPERSTIYARNGSVLAKLYLDENRRIVRLKHIPSHTIKAVLAAEDSGYYEHRGIDYRAVIRAGVRNFVSGEIEQGGSTITQQVARTVYESVGTSDTIKRKVREARVAIRLEREYTKAEILEIYLNAVYFGHGVYGIATAAEWYFGKSIRDVNLAESAMLAGLIAAPEGFSPVNDRSAGRARRGVVLDRMREAGFITPERAAKAKRSKLGLSAKRRKILRRSRAPFFVEFIKQQILDDERFGKTRKARIRTLFQGGLKIYTTLDRRLQRAGERAIDRNLPGKSDPDSAMVAVRPANGAIRALIGGKDFRKQKFNLASQGRRQAGSAFKPFTLVAALEQGISPTRTYSSSSPTVIPMPAGQEPWRVHNASGRGHGRIDLREATQNSVNTVFAQLIMDVGPRRVVRMAHRMGIETDLPAVPSLTLGTAPVSPLEMASAFSTLANTGRHCEPFAIRRVEDRNGKVLVRHRKSCSRAVSRDVATRAVAMLRRVVESGTGTAADLGARPVFGKTGTTDDYGDAWFVGCTVQLCTSTWVGHREARIPMTNVHGLRVFGGTFPAWIWNDFMSIAMRDKRLRDFPDPGPIRAATSPG